MPPNPKLKTPQEIEQLVSRVFQLQSLPASVQKITQLLNSPSATADDIGREIGRDPTFSAQVLKLVNSGFYGFSMPINSISHATVLLGFNVMKTLVLSASVANLLSGAISGLWPHSLACARICAMLSRMLGIDEPEDMSAVGLLHDIGKVVIAGHMKPEFEAIIALVQSENILFVEAERRLLGLTHADIARWLLKKWKLPDTTVEPIARHHALQTAGVYAERASIVHLADILIRAGGFGSGGDLRIPALQPEALAILKLSDSDVPGLVNEMMVELHDFT